MMMIIVFFLLFWDKKGIDLIRLMMGFFFHGTFFLFGFYIFMMKGEKNCLIFYIVKRP